MDFSELIFQDLLFDDDRTRVIAWMGSCDEIKNQGVQISILLYALKDHSRKTFKGDIGDLELSTRTTRKIDAGLLSLLRVGQLVKKGLIVGVARQFLQPLSLRISIQKHHQFRVDPIKEFYSRTDDYRGVKMPGYAFPLILFHSSKMIVLRKGIELGASASYDLVLIPCTEAFSFYFASSANLAQLLASGGLVTAQRNDLYNEALLTSPEEIENGTIPILKLRKSVLDCDAETVSKIAYTVPGRAAALAVANHIRTPGSDGQSHMKCFFPFSGQSVLGLCGKDIACAQFDSKKIFLAYNILSCTGEYPLRNVKFFRDNDSTPGEGGEEVEKDIGGARPNDATEKRPLRITSASGKDPDLEKLYITKSREGFSFRITCTKLTKEEQKTRGSFFKPDKPTSIGTTAPGNDPGSGAGALSTRATEPSDATPDQTDRVTRSVDEYENHFNLLIEKIRSVKGCSIETLTDGDSPYLSFRPDKYREENPIEFSTRSKSYRFATNGFYKLTPFVKRSWQGKRMSIAVIVSKENKNAFLLLDVLKNKSEKERSGYPIFACISNHPSVPIDRDLVEKILEAFALNKGVELKGSQFKELQRAYINHYIPDVEKTFRSLQKFLNKSGLML
jgi:hypothetical protein